MRNLTLGVLIVSGGTLAALPFRRSSSDRATLDAAVRATGPTVSPLDTSTVDVSFSPADDVHATTVGSPSWMPRNITEPMQGERFIQMPDSFSAEVPELPRPKVVAERFSASVDFQSDAVAARQAADHETVMTGDLARAQMGASQMATAPAYPGPSYPSASQYVRGPLIGGAMSSPVATPTTRFSGLAVDAGAAPARLPLGAKEVAGRDTFVSSRAVRPATESLADQSPESETRLAAEAEAVPPLPPAQAERPRLWIRQPE